MSDSLRPHGLHGILQAGILEWVSHFLLQRIFLTQGLNLGLVHCRQILYQLSYEGSPTKDREEAKENNFSLFPCLSLLTVLT